MNYTQLSGLNYLYTKPLVVTKKNNINANETLAILISSNRRLLDKYINEEIIKNLINVENKRKNVMLLSSLCVCKG